jgi:hypothetical protein
MLEGRNKIVGKVMMRRGRVLIGGGKPETCDAGLQDPIMMADIPTHEVNTN